ncbi:MAG TPA: metallophosphoesterase [Roseiflexaceae bacterium]|nr:metallophosphoesterase [Roseiflexaceae bacterium]
MQFLTVSDEVVPAIYSLNVQERFRDIDCVLGCGDLPYYYLDFIVTMLGVPCFYIQGNHDGAEHTEGGQVIEEPQGCVSLEGRTVVHEGLILAGLGGSIRYNGESGAQYTETEMMFRVWRLTPRLLLNRRRYGRYVDILLTHAPPLGIHNGPDRPHRGFQAFRHFMDRFRPRYLIHGHIHRSYGFSAVTETSYNQTLVINTAGYRRLTVEPVTPGSISAAPS